MWNDGRNMKYGHYVTHKNTVSCVKTPYNLVALVEQQSDHIKMLTDKVERLDEFKHTQQCNGIQDDEGNNSGTANEEISTEPMVRSTACDKYNKIQESKWIKRKREQEVEEEK